jgi:hypothetical protein
VCHKLSAMKRVLSKYGAYTAHLTTLSDDLSVKSVGSEDILESGQVPSIFLAVLFLLIFLILVQFSQRACRQTN